MSIIAASEPVAEFGDLPVTAFTTTRAVGSFGVQSAESVVEVMGRWASLRRELATFGGRLATAGQVHGADILTYGRGWQGWLRGESADGHLAPEAGTGVAVTIADCVPVFVAHPRGAVMILHAGWRGTAAQIVTRGMERLVAAGFSIRDARVHLGPAICGSCYEVGPEVYEQLVGTRPASPTRVDLRAILAEQARRAGATHISTSRWCTKCDNDRFYSHRAGDSGRQLGVIVAHGSS